MLKIDGILNGTIKIRKQVKITPKASFTDIEIKQSPAGGIIAIATVKSSTGLVSSYTTKVYLPEITFTAKPKSRHSIPVEIKGKDLYLNPAKDGSAKCQVRCTCDDYYFTFWKWNSDKGSHYGSDMPPYVRKTDYYPERNPGHIPGACKHIFGLLDILSGRGYLV